MQVKRYEVAGINDALIKIKNDLGPDAIIISAKKIRSGKNQAFEVMAARDDKTDLSDGTLEGEAKVPVFPKSKRNDDLLTHISGELKELKEAVGSIRRENSLGRELAEIKETIDKFYDVLGMRKGRAPQDINQKIYIQLLSNGFSRNSACRIIDAVNQKVAAFEAISEQSAMKLVEDYITRSLPRLHADHDQKRIKVFIGPTGVGKTTTLAKLAARYSIMRKMNVGLITTDNFRIAAADQLGAYAKIMGIKMEVASSKEAFQRAVRTFADKDIILVDTPGRAWPDAENVKSWENSVSGNDVETSLLVNATGSDDNLQDIVTKYTAFNINNLIITKIDESRRFGILYDVISKAGKPVTYLTCGQNVPQDIEEVSPSRMANLILKNIAH